MKVFKNRLYGFLVTLIFMCLTSCACTVSNTVASSQLKIVNWNVQTFFDGNKDGNEYSEFLSSSSKWDEDSYMVRLGRLCEVIRESDADVFVMEEIEKEEILYDISNMLSEDSWNTKKVYNWACFAKDEDSSIGCAIISRVELSNMRLHTLGIQSESDEQPSMRPIIEVDLSIDGKLLKVFVNHWKSKSGGEEETDVWRKWQESVLASKMASYAVTVSDSQSGVPCIAIGDFNKDITEFEIIDDGNATSSEGYSAAMLETNDVLQANDILQARDILQANKAPSVLEKACNVPNVFLKYTTLEGEKKLAVYSPWADSSIKNEQKGTYYYDYEWECIDNVFLLGNVVMESFSVMREGKWADEDGQPIGYKIWNQNGYSDHLPIMCVVSL